MNWCKIMMLVAASPHARCWKALKIRFSNCTHRRFSGGQKMPVEGCLRLSSLQDTGSALRDTVPANSSRAPCQTTHLQADWRRQSQVFTLSRVLKALCSLCFLAVLPSEKSRPCLVGVGVRGPSRCALLLSAKGADRRLSHITGFQVSPIIAYGFLLIISDAACHLVAVAAARLLQ